MLAGLADGELESELCVALWFGAAAGQGKRRLARDLSACCEI